MLPHGFQQQRAWIASSKTASKHSTFQIMQSYVFCLNAGRPSRLSVQQLLKRQHAKPWFCLGLQSCYKGILYDTKQICNLATWLWAHSLTITKDGPTQLLLVVSSSNCLASTVLTNLCGRSYTATRHPFHSLHPDHSPFHIMAGHALND